MSIKVEMVCSGCHEQRGPTARLYCHDCYGSQEAEIKALNRLVTALHRKLDRARERLEKARRKK